MFLVQAVSNIYNNRVEIKQKQVQDTKSQNPKQDKLFTPGPLLTSDRVKRSMLHDYGSRDPKFIEHIQNVRKQILQVANVTADEYTTVLIQGSGTFGVESTLTTSVARQNNKVLVVANGAYGLRIAKMLTLQQIPFTLLEYKDNEVIKPENVLDELKRDQTLTHVALIHSETTSGLINPIKEIGIMIKEFNQNIIFIVDAMSSFGAYQILTKDWGIDYLVASSNKNLQGIPGFSFMIARLETLKTCKGNARVLSLDAYDQWVGLESNGQFRFTPPTHVIRAMSEALDEYFERGGQAARYERYCGNQQYMSSEMQKLGFKLYLDPQIQGCIITTFLEPNHPNWIFQEFYDFLAVQSLVIYPGKLTQANSFRIGSIGELTREDFVTLVSQVKKFLEIKKIDL